MLGKYSMQSVAAVIVTFNPDLALLEKNIRAIRPQVTKIILVDNGSKNISNIQLLISELEDVSCLSLRENTGIAAAQNKGFAELYKQGFSWAVLLDQDSEFMAVGVAKYLFEINRRSDNQIDLVAPRYVDRNGDRNINHDDSVFEVEFPIASGTMINVLAWHEVGGMDEKLFIDRVDDDFDLRLRNSGYKLLQISSVYLLHNIGDISTIRLGPWKVNIFNHNAIRKYYIARNAVLFSKKHGDFRDAAQRIVVLIAKVILFEKNKHQKLRSICVGVGDGLTNKGGRY